MCVLVGLIRRQQLSTATGADDAPGAAHGFQFVYASKIILGFIALDMLAVFLGGATALLPIYAEDILFVGANRTRIPVGRAADGVHPLRVHPEPPAAPAKGRTRDAVGRDRLRAGHDGFGLSKWFWFSLLMLFTCGAVDNISVVVRHTLVQMLTPDDKRGRVSAVNNLFIGTSNELGEFESGIVAQIFGPALGNTIVTGAVVSAVSGGVGTILTVLAVALDLAGNPEVRTVGRDLTRAQGGLFSTHETNFNLVLNFRFFLDRGRPRKMRPSNSSTNSAARFRT